MRDNVFVFYSKRLNATILRKAFFC